MMETDRKKANNGENGLRYGMEKLHFCGCKSAKTAKESSKKR